MRGLLLLLLPLSAVFCLQDQVEESLDACPACSAVSKPGQVTWSMLTAQAAVTSSCGPNMKEHKMLHRITFDNH